MSDDIDIEEHDVMDNPSIKRIFPDLSVIKQEINRYYEEDGTLETEHEESTSVTTNDFKTMNTADIHNCNDIFTSTNLNVDIKHLVEPDCLYGNITHPIEPDSLYGNIIILGSKPSLECIKSNNVINQEPKLVLENIGPFLNECKKYCKECRILFPKLIRYTIHKINYHTKKKKSASKKVPINNFKCKICKKIMSSRSNLYRHIKNLHKYADKKSNTLNKKIIEDTTTKSSIDHSCFHCQELFPTRNSLIEHLYDVLSPRKAEIRNHNDCDKDMDESKNKEYNKNLNKLQTLEQKYNNCLDSHLKDNNLHQVKTPETESGSNEVGSEEYKTEIKQENVMERPNDELVKCKKCKEQFSTEKKLGYHIMDAHKNDNYYLTRKNKGKLKRSVRNFNQIKNPFMFYQCSVCSQYNASLKFHSRHMLTYHNIKTVVKPEKVQFRSRCEFCSSEMSGIKSYNSHLSKYHKTKVNLPVHSPKKQSNEKNYAFEGVLFECLKCDIYFLSAGAAMNHSKHSKFLTNWKCPVCHRILKNEDKLLHEKQHLLSKTIMVYSLSKFGLKRIFYKCCKCTVHYSEENFLLHHENCDSETPNSVYCKVCDILINRNDMEFHKINHEEKIMKYSDFTIIESDVIDDQRPTKNNTKINSDTTSETNRDKLTMAFCNTCKCFISNIKLTRKVHIEAKCSHMLKTICKVCGLVLTMKTHTTHVLVHKKKQINLQDYVFYDLKSKEQIYPPLPDFPHCNMCGVHFLRKDDIRTHSCQLQDYKTCNICSIKLTKHAYKLHMSYHNYSIKNDKTEQNSLLYKDLNSCLPGEINVKEIIFLYTCKSCQIVVNSYDEVVQHCQDHYDYKETQLTIRKCEHCQLLCKENDYECHNKAHLNGTYNKDLITIIDFDPFYFRFNNIFWTKHIFAYISNEQIRYILDNSKYKHEFRLKMEELKPGASSLNLYKCGKCHVFVDPEYIYVHGKGSRSISCDNLRKHPCAFCGSYFNSLTYRMAHEKEHEGVYLRSHRILIFNKIEHESFNNLMYDMCYKYILYQCRNCERVVDKFQRKGHFCETEYLRTCMTCGLLFHKLDYDLHFIRHEELHKFNANNIIVVLFGKMCNLDKKEFRSSFRGTIHDFTIYKCKNCELCLRTKGCVSAHACVSNESKSRCTKCGLFFFEQELAYHYKLHGSNFQFDEFNINIVTFDKSSTVAKIRAKETKEIKNGLDGDFIEKPFVENGNLNRENLEIIYKCKCGLHFLEEANAQRHAKGCNVRMKISKQSCFKCDLLFTPGELFNHLLKHHCDKKLQYKFDIVLVCNNDNETAKS